MRHGEGYKKSGARRALALIESGNSRLQQRRCKWRCVVQSLVRQLPVSSKDRSVHQNFYVIEKSIDEILVQRHRHLVVFINCRAAVKCNCSLSSD